MKPVRVQLSRRRGWRMPDNTVKVARRSRFGNPYVIGHKRRHVDGTLQDIPDRATAVRLYREWVAFYLQSNPAMLEALRGKNLACWCPPGEPCHADVLLELANR